MSSSKTWWGASLLAVSVLSLACGDDGRDTGENAATAPPSARDAAIEPRADAGARGRGNADASAAMPTSGDEECTGLLARIRDFSSVHGNDNSNPDFEARTAGIAIDGLVEDVLGADSKPVFKSVGRPQAITSAATFLQWYNDTPGVNIAIPYTIPLTQKGTTGTYEFSSSAFFPIDNQGWNAPDSKVVEPMLRAVDGKLHNFNFTTEVHTSFTYRGGESFTFKGDDDLWIFVNKKLALDLGGVHAVASGSIDFDALAQRLGIVKGKTYSMDIFHAERHTSASNFSISTNIDCFVPVLAI